MKKCLVLLALLIPMFVLQASPKNLTTEVSEITEKKGFSASSAVKSYVPLSKKESVIRIEVPYHDAVYQLQDRYHLSVIDAQDYYIDAYADEKLINALKNAGYKVTVLIEDYQTESAELLQAIHTYTQVCSTMVALNQLYPGITKLETLGFSYGNRVILVMKVTDNPLIEEAEPEIRLVGTHHGNEKISTEVTLSFLKYLTENYSSNTQVSDLVDNREIWIIPILNPDGHVANNRTNGAGVDINRDYGYMWSGEGSSPGPWSQPEPRAIQKHSQNNNISLEYEYHSAASYVNYVWDHMPIDPPDSGYIIQISQEYADSTYGSSTTRLYKINGYDWYYVRGSAQDAVFGIWGAIATTIETQYPTTQVKVDSICVANRRALMSMITRVGWGISGIVRDSITQTPLFAMIKFTNPKRWSVYTDKQLGDFHKMTGPGDYTFMAQANGYLPKTFSVTVPTNGVVNVEIDLVPDTTSLYYVQKLIWVRRDRPDMVFRTITMDGLGIPDSIYYSLGPVSSVGTIVLEADPPIRNFPGYDFTVYEAGTTPENFSVSVSNDWRSSWYSCGTGNSTTNFDLTTTGFDSVRYIKIVDASGSSSSDPYAGFDLDGISYRKNQSAILENISLGTIGTVRLAIYPNPTKSLVNIKYQKSNIKNTNQTLKIFNIEGRLVKEFNLNSNEENIIWDTRDKLGNLVPSGIYFCVIDEPQGMTKQKVVINR